MIANNDIKQGLLYIVLILLFLATTPAASFYFYQKRPVQPIKPVTVTVLPGSSFTAIAKQLESAGVIESHFMFKLVAKWTKKTTGIQAGSYHFYEAATPHQVLDRLSGGDVILQSVTIPEGLTLKEIAQRLEQKDLVNMERFLALTHDSGLLKQLAITADSMEGYLFPETYRFVPETDEDGLIRIMAAELQRRFSSKLDARLKELGWNRHQLLTLASIVQKEAGNIDEMPLIAAVFHNRLRRGMRLQADPTVIYGMGDAYQGNIRKKDLLRDTSYNTYTRGGLPPGPIAAPGEAAIHAAAWPAKNKYLYFVARRDGTHQFSRTLKEHNAAVKKYQLRRR